MNHHKSLHFLSNSEKIIIRDKSDDVFENGVIEIKTSEIHNVKSMDVQIPKGKLTVVTGVSGSGKNYIAFGSSLSFC